MTGILFDLDGVFYQNGQPISGAAQALNWVTKQNIPHLFVTNTSSKPRAAIVDKLAAFGITTDPQHILTPPIAANNWLANELNSPRVALYVAEATKADFSNTEIARPEEQQIDAVVIGDLGEQWSFELMNTAFNQLMASPDAQLIALGLTRYWKTSAGLQLDVGPFVKALEYATGKEALVCGKPSASFFQAAAQQLQQALEQLLMIGDDIQGDIAGAQRTGLKAMLVRTGKFQPSDLQQSIIPDAIIDSIADLPDWWAQHIESNN
jgi:HAD superfamily hydrolase (TIGR01458 family)